MEMQEIYNLIFNKMLNGFALIEAIYDKDGHPRDYRYMDINSAYEEIMGISREDILGKTVMDVYPRMEKYWLETLHNALVTGETTRIENYFIERDKYFDRIAYRVKEGYLAVIFNDITDRKKMEIKLNKYREILEKVLEERTSELKKLEWLLSKKPAHNRQHYMPFYGDLTKLNTSGEILSSVGADLIEDIVSDYMDLLDTSSAVYEKNGDYVLGIFSSGWCQFLDMTSRKNCNTEDNTAALNCGKWHCHESCWHDAAKVSIETGLPADIECNGGLRIYSLPIRAGEEIVGAINFGYGDPPGSPGKLKEICEKYNVTLEELQKYSNSYETRPPYLIELAKKRLHSSARLIGEIINRNRMERAIKKAQEGLNIMVEERTTELIEAREKLMRQEKLALLGQLAGGVGHELRNPLGVMSNAVYFLKMLIPDGGEMVKTYFDIISGEINKSGKIISDLLDLSRLKPGEREKINLFILTECLVKKMFIPENIKVIYEVEPSIPFVFADPKQIEQVMFNLISNACQAMPQGGNLIIASIVDSSCIHISIGDTGGGISKENMNNVFEPLFTTKARGIGLGLSVSKNLIEINGGAIKGESLEGRGSIFTISLPLYRE